MRGSPFNPWSLTLVLAMAMFGHAFAEGDAIEEESEVRGRKLWLLAVGLPEGLENPVTVLAGGKLEKLTLSKRAMSGPLKVPADGVIQIVRVLPNPEQPDVPRYRTIGRARIPTSASKAMAIFVPKAKEDEDGLLFSSRVLDLDEFEGGDYLYMNLSPLRIAATLGEERLVIDPGKLRIADSLESTGSRNVPTSYHVYSKERERWNLLSASTVVVRSTRREICIFAWDPRFKRVGYHGVTFPVEMDQ